ncbi:MAG: tRNA (adenosine(37)-N6)-threonylcarbamoyltransferase complex ATPase subunit type 1 TsaE [Acidimicrobiia bacterium]|nr:MAG: tRNA (adenosine(37)-N6)-threonylcarbamoyltransferase complex ATPase subunit type 1 TsaE [Acidimicrobiia bacterium]
MNLEIISSSPDETMALGRRFAPLLTAGDIVLLSGRLGSGKTLFVSGVAEGLGIRERVTSPTFVISRIYTDGFLPLVHADVYRLGSVAEFHDLELPDDGVDGAVLVEWGDVIAGSMPPDRLTIDFALEGDTRRISFQPQGTWMSRNLNVLL